ncbi:hypothetical protein D554_2235 [Bordetella holmesii 30539]|uniref:Uncharacterized protein n=2 Tax=Bordetella holmesii TaxID=35814 RepID=A0A158M7D8_9BORD|nr:hypothetical protein D560_0456 [Bordetella holmesii ATCC 51541]AIT25143.1 hypothetical protein D558_0454 [Bordetella holmesii 44057]EWM45710.1 hypothetical protein D557_3718 [Bordetella holmesii 70147]EWM48575.1 hypothetical protein D556_0455 [Bordetella holmesii 41130]EWM49831.1 hypothetical protein D555_0459 [Bordetella holmesii 35009]EXF86982.1 hypothetical protein D554_2235 [Bordetella holmesii 30539]EXX94993.1 hypothetical protein D559_2420 [Bordetella holmesii 1058]KAK83947.1 hypoth
MVLQGHDLSPVGRSGARLLWMPGAGRASEAILRKIANVGNGNV